MRVAALLVLLLVAPTLASAQEKPPIFGKNLSPEFLALAREAAAQRQAPRAKKPKPTQGNPIAFTWTCPNHATHSQHELDVIEVYSGAVVQTVLLGNPVQQATGEVVATFNLHVSEPGTYIAVVRFVGQSGPSEDSEPSDAWVASQANPGKGNQ